MNFTNAMLDAVTMASETGRIYYIYKLINGGFGISRKIYPDWLFKAYPGGRKVLSPSGAAFRKKESV
jgi:hypothetical protein